MNRPFPVRRQRGAVLIVSLVLLVVLTLLGLSAMNQTSLQEKMAVGMQESVQAFQAAESGLAAAYADDTSWTVTSTPPQRNLRIAHQKSSDADVQRTDEAAYDSTFRAWAVPPPESLFSAHSFRAAHFDLKSASTSFGGLRVVLHAGAYQIAPK